MTGKNDTSPDRLFVPLNSDPYRGFESGGKTAEFRGVNSKFNIDTVFVGRTVELRRGYSTDDSLWGEITAVDTGTTIESLVCKWFSELQYKNRTKEEMIQSVKNQLSDYDEFIIFKLELTD